jgi:TIR domain-containing protein
VAVKIFFCYAPNNERMLHRLLRQMKHLEREGIIDTWYDLDISAGSEREPIIHKYLYEAQVILLLISPEFMSSSSCYDVMKRAIVQHERGKVRVIPVILRPVLWQVLDSLRKLQVLPDDAKPVSDWRPTQDHGFINVVEGIYKVVQQLASQDLPDLIGEKEIWMENFEKFVEAVRLQLQPEARANATASTLQQLSLSALVPNGTTLADLLVGWRLLAYPREGEEIGVVKRRVTCDELAAIATQFTNEEGNLSKAIQVWQAWYNAFSDSTDPRHATMAKTFARELEELQESAR